MAVDISNYVAAFGKRGTGNPGAGIGYGLRAQQMRNRNRMADLARQDEMQERNRLAAQKRKQEEAEFGTRWAKAMVSAQTPEQKQEIHRGGYDYGMRAGFDMEGIPAEYTPDFEYYLAGKAGVELPGATDTRTPAAIQNRQALFGILEDPNAPDWKKQAARVELNLDPRPSSAGAKVVMVEMEDGRQQPFLQFADGSVQPFASGIGGGVPTGGQPGQNGQAPQQPVSQDRFVTRTPEEEAAAVTRAKVSAKKDAESAADLPRYRAQVEENVALIDQALNHPGLAPAVGKSSVLPTMPGTEKANFQVLLNQLKGKNFLNAFESLKGGGQITEIEGKAAQDAMARLDTSQTEEEFKHSLQDLREILQAGLRRKQGAVAEQQPAETGTQTSQIRFLGFE